MLVSTAAIGTNATPMAASEPDPIFAAIERCKAAEKECRAVSVEINRQMAAVDAKLGPSSVAVMNHETGLLEDAVCWSDIERCAPKDRFPEYNRAMNASLTEQKRRWQSASVEFGSEEWDDMIAGPADEELRAARAFADTLPCSWAGLAAMIEYAAYLEDNRDLGSNAEVYTLPTMAEAVRNLKALPLS